MKSETHFKFIPHVAARDMTFVDRSTDLIGLFSTIYVVTPAQPPTCSSVKITNRYRINFWFILPASSDSVAFTFLFAGAALQGGGGYRGALAPPPSGNACPPVGEFWYFSSGMAIGHMTMFHSI